MTCPGRTTLLGTAASGSVHPVLAGLWNHSSRGLRHDRASGAVRLGMDEVPERTRDSVGSMSGICVDQRLLSWFPVSTRACETSRVSATLASFRACRCPHTLPGRSIVKGHGRLSKTAASVTTSSIARPAEHRRQGIRLTRDRGFLGVWKQRQVRKPALLTWRLSCSPRRDT